MSYIIGNENNTTPLGVKVVKRETLFTFSHSVEYKDVKGVRAIDNCYVIEQLNGEIISFPMDTVREVKTL